MNSGQVLRAPHVVVLRLSPAQARAAAAFIEWGAMYYEPAQRGAKELKKRAEGVAATIRNKLRGKNP